MAGEQVLNGRDYILEIDVDTPIDAENGLAYRPLVCEVVTTFGINTSDIAISNSCTGAWESRIPNKSGFTFSGEWQAINPTTGDPDAYTMAMITWLAATRKMFWARRKLKSGAMGVEVYREGVVWINRYEDVAGAEEPFMFSADFVGVGAPTIDAGYDIIGLLADYKSSPIVTGSDEFIAVKAGSGLGGAPVPEEPTRGLVIGGTPATGLEQKVLTDTERTRGFVLNSIAMADDTIAEQKTLWDSISDKSQYDYILVHLGLHDLGSANAVSQYQAFISHLKDTGKPGVDIIISALTPARQWFVDQGNPTWQTSWQSFNQAISNTIEGAVGRVTSHVARMSDGNSNLLSIYDAGDHVNLDPSGKNILAGAWRDELIRLNLIK